jgi:hypothetical protein
MIHLIYVIKLSYLWTADIGKKNILVTQKVKNRNFKCLSNTLLISAMPSSDSYLCFLSQLLVFSPKSCGICGGQNGIDMGFIKELWFVLKISIPPSDPPHSLHSSHDNVKSQWTVIKHLGRNKISLFTDCEPLQSL